MLIIAGVLAGVLASRTISQTVFQLQAGRDALISALFIAQHRAMAQEQGIQLRTSAAAIDIRQDSNNNGAFEASESIRLAGSSYPASLPIGVSLAVNQLTFDRLGRTHAVLLTLSKGSESITVTVSGTGYAY